MGYIQGFGFEIYRLREAKVDSEFLLYNVKDNKYNTYSEKRINEILRQELKAKKIEYKKFIKEEVWNQIEDKDENKKIIISNKKVKDIFSGWIDEEIVLIDNIGFKPINDRVFIKDDKKYFNTFNIPDTLDPNKYKLDDEMTLDSLKEQAPNIYSLLSNLHAKDEKAIKDTLYKLADKVQNPFEKAQDCIIFYPAEAAGKGIFYKHIIHPIFKEYSSKILMNKLNNDFNAFIRKTLVLVIEEGKRDVDLIETLKEIVTESTMLINEKGKNQTEEEVYFLTFVFSNNMNPIDLGKRRGSYHMCKSLGKTKEQSQDVGANLCEKIPEEIETLLHYLHSLNVIHQKALMPFNTIAKEQVNELNKNTLELFYDYICTFPNMESCIYDSFKRRFRDDLSPDLSLQTKEEDIFISKNIIKDTYNNFCIIEGFRTNLIRHNKDIVQLWALMNIPQDSHKRILLSTGDNKGRKLDHLRLIDINKHINEVYSNG